MNDNMEQKIESVLGNPELMQKIMTMAKELGSSEPSPSSTPSISQDSSTLAMINKLSGLGQQTAIDSQQKALLSALAPYLPKDRISKLEHAMRAAKLAQIASRLAGSSQFSFLPGR